MENLLFISEKHFNLLRTNILNDLKETSELLSSDNFNSSKVEIANVKFELEMLKLCIEEFSEYDFKNEEYVLRMVELNKDRLIGYLLTKLEDLSLGLS